MLLPKQTLTPEARKQFKLFSNPFTGEVQTEQQMFDGSEVRFVREAVWQCAQNGGFMALVGESGSGKTISALSLRMIGSGVPVGANSPNQPDIRAQFLSLALRVNGGSPEELAAILRKDYDAYGKLVKDLNLRLD